MTSDAPIWALSDGTLLVDETHPRYREARDCLRDWAELYKRPGALHTYRVTPVTLWNAAAAGWTAEAIVEKLRSLSRGGVPAALEALVREQIGRYGRLRLYRRGERLLLRAADERWLNDWADWQDIVPWLGKREDRYTYEVKPEGRGALKRILTAAGYPVLDEAGYRTGGRIPIGWRQAGEQPDPLRDYQREAVDAFLGRPGGEGGSGVVVLPCGAGKTWVGMGAMTRLQCDTLILTPNGVSVTQWRRELLAHTTLSERDIGEYTGRRKDVRPVTVATYQVLTYRRAKDEPYPHWRLFVDREWGLIIYDEVHLLPAPVFRMTADLQATRRLGLTATLVREDGLESDVFALIGPKRYSVPWRTIEERGFIAEAACTEVRVPMDERTRAAYAAAPKRSRHRIAGENPRKAEAVRRLLDRHAGEPALIIGHYLDQLRRLAEELSLPLVTGELPQEERERLFDRFNRGELQALAVSKVANFAVDLPDAAVAIQVSGSFGSRQEEAQRLGRILRPKRGGGGAAFYTLVSDGTEEVEFSRKRQQFLLEQGYPYETERWPSGEAAAGERAP